MTRIELAVWKHIGKELSRYAGHYIIAVEFFMREAMLRIGAELLVRRTHIVFTKLRVFMNEAEKERIWNFYVELDEMQRHFNTLQSTYRTMASTWLLAAFAGTGFVLSTELNLSTV